MTRFGSTTNLVGFLIADIVRPAQQLKQSMTCLNKNYWTNKRIYLIMGMHLEGYNKPKQKRSLTWIIHTKTREVKKKMIECYIYRPV